MSCSKTVVSPSLTVMVDVWSSVIGTVTSTGVAPTSTVVDDLAVLQDHELDRRVAVVREGHDYPALGALHRGRGRRVLAVMRDDLLGHDLVPVGFDGDRGRLVLAERDLDDFLAARAHRVGRPEVLAIDDDLEHDVAATRVPQGDDGAAARTVVGDRSPPAPRATRVGSRR